MAELGHTGAELGRKGHGRMRGPRLVALALIGVVLFSPAMLSLFDRPSRVFGVPLLWAYLFLAWLLIIGLLAFVARRSE